MVSHFIINVLILEYKNASVRRVDSVAYQWKEREGGIWEGS